MVRQKTPPRSQKPAPKKKSVEGPPLLCIPAPLHKLPKFLLWLAGCCPLPLQKSSDELLAAFQNSPQFSEIDPQQLLSQQRDSLRVILFSQSCYYARQCALYLSTLALQQRGLPSASEKDAFWSQLNLDLPNQAANDSQQMPQTLRTALAVVSAPALDPGLSMGAGPDRPMPAIHLAQLDAPAALIYAEDGEVLTPGVLDHLIEVMSRHDPTRTMDLFLALKPSQMGRDTLEDLRFTYGFHVQRVGIPDQACLRRVLRTEADDLLLSIEPQADLDQVIAHTRQFRGDKFTELDLRSLVHWAVQRQDDLPLRTADMLFQPYQTQSPAQKELDAMVSLGPVKERLLAASKLERQRLMEGEKVLSACRNMAFSGPPGTGESVTTRLLARIMQEEGCGSGRFVEAGREQLIGSYLGQTSPMVAKLFQQARGGVLFIDEAGALLDMGQDIYAVEAVNALVRHMELSPETMVIFATYPGEMERFFSSNPGLSSRVAQILDFAGYDNDQVWDILNCFAQREDYTLPSQAKESCMDFFSALRRQKKADFGNGREARRLFQAAVEELALRLRKCPEETVDLIPADLEQAARRLLSQPGKRLKRTMDFERAAHLL